MYEENTFDYLIYLLNELKEDTCNNELWEQVDEAYSKLVNETKEQCYDEGK